MGVYVVVYVPVPPRFWPIDYPVLDPCRVCCLVHRSPDGAVRHCGSTAALPFFKFLSGLGYGSSIVASEQPRIVVDPFPTVSPLLDHLSKIVCGLLADSKLIVGA